MKRIDKMIRQIRGTLRAAPIFEVMSRATRREMHARKKQLKNENPFSDVVVINIVSHPNLPNWW